MVVWDVTSCAVGRMMARRLHQQEELKMEATCSSETVVITARLHDVTTPKSIIYIFATVKTPQDLYDSILLYVLHNCMHYKQYASSVLARYFIQSTNPITMWPKINILKSVSQNNDSDVNKKVKGNNSLLATPRDW
jgi:hypothetical protein